MTSVTAAAAYASSAHDRPGPSGPFIPPVRTRDASSPLRALLPHRVRVRGVRDVAALRHVVPRRSIPSPRVLRKTSRAVPKTVLPTSLASTSIRVSRPCAAARAAARPRETGCLSEMTLRRLTTAISSLVCVVFSPRYSASAARVSLPLRSSRSSSPSSLRLRFSSARLVTAIAALFPCKVVPPTTR